ncbi:MAG: substrate-binding domain-containing protein [Deltaproteobacteria bacterium]|nr:substrate-binding domain-containing protein [Deltaproteobacteria bacterium]
MNFYPMKKNNILLALLALLVLSPFSAQARQPEEQKTSENPRVLMIPGTGDSQVLLRKLAQLYAKNRPGIPVEIPESIGSGGGIRSVITGKNEIARVARPLTEKENAQGLKSRIFAQAPVVFAVNPGVTGVETLSPEQIIGIYSGRIPQWDALDAALSGVGKIYVMNREEGDSSRTVLERLIPGFKEIAVPAGATVYSTPEAVQTLMASPNTIGYLPMPAVVGTGLKMLQVQGVAPSAANVRQKKYQMVIPFALVWKDTLTPRAQDFLDFLSSPAAKKLMLDNGAIPVE